MDQTLGRSAARAHERRATRMHEIRTPLWVVVGRVQLLRRRLRRGDDPAQLATELEAIEAALVRLAAAVKRVDDVGPE